MAKESKHATETIKEWLDAQEEILHKEAMQAGLLGHGSSVGAAHEFFVKRVLKSVLPKSIHIGSGIVFAGDKRSKQIDVVLYDDRFPVLEIEDGFGLYFAEGVIATIEIKSTMTITELRRSLDNCHSVLDLPLIVSQEDLNLLAAKNFDSSRESAADFEQRIYSALKPDTYIFAFENKVSHKKFGNTVDEWYMSKGMPLKKHCVYLPKVIAARGILGIQSDSILMLDPGEDVNDQIAKKFADYRCVMGIWKTTWQFGWLIMRLLEKVARRLGSQHSELNVAYNFRSSLPFGEYYVEELKAKLCHYISWTAGEKTAVE